jgi:hypothetical protein
MDQFAIRMSSSHHRVDGYARARLVDDDVLTLQRVARYTKTSDTTIKKLLEGGILPCTRSSRLRSGTLVAPTWPASASVPSSSG